MVGQRQKSRPLVPPQPPRDSVYMFQNDDHVWAPERSRHSETCRLDTALVLMKVSLGHKDGDGSGEGERDVDGDDIEGG